MAGREDGARRRRSPRLHSQTHASDEAVGLTRLHPQDHASEEGAGVARGRRRPRSQIHATGEGAGVIRRRGSFPAALASPIEDDDLLREILLRLPPQPSSLLRASAVCKQWRCAATDPKFLQRFRLHHRKPPLLGLFHRRKDDIVFTPIMDRPDRIPPRRFDLQLRDINSNMWMLELLDCRHGRVLLTGKRPNEVILCDPITGEQRRVTVPPEFVRKCFNGAVLCAFVDHDHVHGSCHSSPFNVVLISGNGVYDPPIACVYSSETGVWGDIISTTVPCVLFDEGISGLLVGNALYWLLESIRDGILKFDLDEKSLSVISGPPVTDDFGHCSHFIIQAEDDAVGFAILSYPHLHMWQRNINCHGVATWVLWKIIDMRTILGFPPHIQGERPDMRRILGCVEDTDGKLLVLSVGRSVYMVQLKSMKSRKLCENSYYTHFHSFKSFYLPGTATAGRSDGAGMLHNT